MLDLQYQNAPASVQSQLRDEADNLRLRANQLEQNQYDPGTRKSMQSESWTVSQFQMTSQRTKLWLSVGRTGRVARENPGAPGERPAAKPMK